MTPQQRRSARKAAAGPELDLTLQLHDVLSAPPDGLTGASLVDELCRLVEAKADVTASDLDRDEGDAGSTVLMFAALHGHGADALRRLLAARADAGARNAAGFTALHSLAARRAPDAAAPEMLKVLLEARCDPSAPASPSGLTPLHVAASWRGVEMCRLLRDAGADPTAQEAGGATPLDWAARGRPSFQENAALRRVLAAGG